MLPAHDLLGFLAAVRARSVVQSRLLTRHRRRGIIRATMPTGEFVQKSRVGQNEDNAILQRAIEQLAPVAGAGHGLHGVFIPSTPSPISAN